MDNQHLVFNETAVYSNSLEYILSHYRQFESLQPLDGHNPD